MAHQGRGDPVIEAALLLAKRTEFRPESLHSARIQVTRHLRQQNRDAAQRLVARFRAPEEAARIRELASSAHSKAARTERAVKERWLSQTAQGRIDVLNARLKEQEAAEDQLAAQVKSQVSAAVEEQAKLARMQQDALEQRERAASVAMFVARGQRVLPLLRRFTQHQRQQLAAVRARMTGEAEPLSDAALLERVGQLCGALQQEIWQQLNTASMTAEAATSMPGALLLTAAGEQAPDPYTGALSTATSGGGAGAGGSGAAAGLEAHLHLPKSSPLLQHVGSLLQQPPRRLLAAVEQLASAARNGLVALVGGWDLLADAKRRCQELGAAVDPLYDLRRMQQAHLDCVLELQALQGEVRAAKAQLLRLAAAGPAREALAQPGVRAWVQSEAYAAALATARQARDAVRRDAIAQLQLVEEVNRLEAGARKIEREGARMEGLVALLTHSLGQVMAEWQQQYPTNQDFVRNTLPGCYAHVIEWAGRCQDRLSRCVAELMRVPREVLPAAAEQGRLHGGAGAADPAARGRSGGGFSLPPASSLALVDRMALALPYVAAPRAAAQLRAAASAGPSPAAASTALNGGLGGSLVLRGSGASGGTGGGLGDAGLLGAGSGGLGSSTGFGLGASGGGWPGMGMGSASGAGGGFGGFGSAHGGMHGGGMPGVGPGLSSVGAGAAAAAAAQAGMSWSPGAAALGLPTLCYWLAMAAAAEPLAPLRCPSSLLHDLMARFEGHEQTAMWLAQAHAKLRARFRDLAALRPVCAALRERLGAKRAADGAERVAVLARSRRDIGELVAAIAPNVERALRELEEQGAVRLAPWKKVNGRSAGEYLDEMRSLFARIEQLQAQHAQLQGHAAQHAQHTQQLGFGPPQPSTVGVSRLGF